MHKDSTTLSPHSARKQTLRLILGDCIERLKEMEDNSIGSVITDPPYGISFMNKDWDSPWKHSISETGFAGKDYPKTPSFTSSRNPVCRNCHCMKRGSVRHTPCSCEEPDFDDLEENATDRQLFQDWCKQWLTECYRVLKPGGVIKVFGGTRMFHRMAKAIEEVGFVLEPKDSLEAWMYGSGFPKSMSLSKAIDKMAGAEREVVGTYSSPEGTSGKSDGTGVKCMAGVGIGGLNLITAPATDAAKQFEPYGTALKPAWEPFIVARKPV